MSARVNAGVRVFDGYYWIRSLATRKLFVCSVRNGWVEIFDSDDPPLPYEQVERNFAFVEEIKPPA